MPAVLSSNDAQTTLQPSMGRGASGPSSILALTLLHRPDLGRVGARVLLLMFALGQEEALSRTQPALLGLDGSAHPLANPYVSRRPLRLVPGSKGGVTLLAESLNYRVDGAPGTGCERLSPEDIERGVLLELGGRVLLLLHRVHPGGPSKADDLGLIGISDAMKELRGAVRRVGPLGGAVLVHGASGSGKELVSRAIHQLSARAKGPFVAVNLAAIPASTAATELFGHARGAFTGAAERRRGYFEQAEGGTLLLDEREAPLEIQPMLLRALESGEIQPVGASPRKVDVRVICATDANLGALVLAGRFRRPLLHRVEASRVDVPPLRDRREDIALLFARLLEAEMAAVGASERLTQADPREEPWLPTEVTAALCQHAWPGNVRELQNVVRELAVRCAGHDRASLPERWTSPSTPPPRSRPPALPPSRIEPEQLRAALRRNRWRIGATARDLGIAKNSLYALMESTPGVRRAKDVEEDEVRAALAACGDDLRAAAERLEVSLPGLKARLRALQDG